MNLPTRDHNSSKPKDNLDLSHGALKAVPSDLTRFHHLRALRLDNNQIEEVPWNLLMNMPDLTALNLSDNLITEVPGALGKWSTLKLLNITHNRIKTFTEIPEVPQNCHIDRVRFKEARPDRVEFNRVSFSTTVNRFGYYEIREGAHPTEHASPRILLHNNPVCVSIPRLDNDWHNLANEWRLALAAQQEEVDSDSSDPEVKSDRKKDRRDDTRRHRREQREKSRGKGLAREDKHAP